MYLKYKEIKNYFFNGENGIRTIYFQTVHLKIHSFI